jgi:hypothetical protein
MKISNKRYKKLMDYSGKVSLLTEEEMEFGWHFCSDWDFLLISPDMKEHEFCNCERRIKHEN